MERKVTVCVFKTFPPNDRYANTYTFQEYSTERTLLYGHLVWREGRLREDIYSCMYKNSAPMDRGEFFFMCEQEAMLIASRYPVLVEKDPLSYIVNNYPVITHYATFSQATKHALLSVLTEKEIHQLVTKEMQI